MTQDAGLSNIPVVPSNPSGSQNGSTPAQQQLQDFNATQRNAPTAPVPTRLKKKPQEIPEGPEGTPDSDEVPGTRRVANKASEEARRVRSQGGLLLGVIALILLIWLLIPTASGMTRLQLLWLTIIGRTDLVEQQSSQQINVVNSQGPSDQQLSQDGVDIPLRAQQPQPDASLLFGSNTPLDW